MKEWVKGLVSLFLTVFAITATYFVNEFGLAAIAVIWILVVVAVGLVIFGERLTGLRIISKFVEVVPRAEEQQKEPPPVPAVIPQPVCDPGPQELEGGEFVSIPLDVDAEDHITGRLEEVDGDHFDWFIVDELNLVSFRNRTGAKIVDGEDDVAAGHIDWKVKEGGPWFLVLSNYHRFNTRIIEVHLRRE